MKNIAESVFVRSNIRLLEAWIESRMAYEGLPGLSAGIIYDQELIWSGGFGFADPEANRPATPRTIYRIASISKLFTSTAVMQLRDEGRLQLDDPVSKYLPWFKIGDPYPDSPPATIRHLLTHTSGLPREAPFPYWSDFRFPTRDQVRESLPRQEACYPRESKWKYSNLALALAGEIVAAVSGIEYKTYIRQNILDPLGMDSTSVILPEKDREERLAKGFSRRMPDGSRRELPFSDTKGITPAANLSSTVEDLAKFISLQFRDGSRKGNQVLKGSTLREMQRVHWMRPGMETAWGLGFSLSLSDGKIRCGHGGGLGGYRTHVSFCPEEKIGAVVLTNANNGEPDLYVEKIFKWVAPAIKKALEYKEEEPKADPELRKYLGKYRDLWGDTEVMFYEGDLVMICPRDGNPIDSMIRLIPLGNHRFRMEGDAGYLCLGETAIFEFDKEGKVIRARDGENYIFPVKSWNDSEGGWTSLLES